VHTIVASETALLSPVARAAKEQTAEERSLRSYAEHRAASATADAHAAETELAVVRDQMVFHSPSGPSNQPVTTAPAHAVKRVSTTSPGSNTTPVRTHHIPVSAPPAAAPQPELSDSDSEEWSDSESESEGGRGYSGWGSHLPPPPARAS